jgi:uncharacterized protein
MKSSVWGVFWYLLLTFGIAWGAWQVGIDAGVSVVSAEFQLYALPGAFAPAIAAIIVRKWITREGFADAGLGLHLRGWPYYLVALFLPLFVVGVIAAEASLLGIATPDFSLTRAMADDSEGSRVRAFAETLSGRPVIPALMLFALISTPILWGEEFGWRGYLQQRLLVGRPVASAIVIGAIWGVWHFPLTLRGYNYPDHPELGSALFVVMTIFLAYIFGWIFRRSGSIWASSLAHAATNGVGGTLTVLWFAGVSGPTILSYTGILAGPPLLAVCACIYFLERGSKSAYEPRPV